MGKNKVVEKNGKWICKRCGEPLGKTKTEAMKKYRGHECKPMSAKALPENIRGKTIYTMIGEEHCYAVGNGQKLFCGVEFPDGVHVKGVLEYQRGGFSRPKFDSDGDMYVEIYKGKWTFFVSEVKGKPKKNTRYYFKWKDNKIVVLSENAKY